MGWCARMCSLCMCVTKSAQGAGKLIFGVEVVPNGVGTKMVSATLTLTQKMRSEVWRSRDFNWPYLGHFSTDN